MRMNQLHRMMAVLLQEGHAPALEMSQNGVDSHLFAVASEGDSENREDKSQRIVTIEEIHQARDYVRDRLQTTLDNLGPGEKVQNRFDSILGPSGSPQEQILRRLIGEDSGRDPISREELRERSLSNILSDVGIGTRTVDGWNEKVEDANRVDTAPEPEGTPDGDERIARRALRDNIIELLRLIPEGTRRSDRMLELPPGSPEQDEALLRAVGRQTGREVRWGRFGSYAHFRSSPIFWN